MMSQDESPTGNELESPLHQRSVQWTLLSFVSVLMVATLFSWHRSTPNHWGVDSSVASDPSTIFLIDINAAEKHELSLLPGVGKVLADRIVNDRDQNGEFISVDDLHRVYGIGPKTMNDISRMCFVAPKSAVERSVAQQSAAPDLANPDLANSDPATPDPADRFGYSR